MQPEYFTRKIQLASKIRETRTHPRHSSHSLSLSALSLCAVCSFLERSVLGAAAVELVRTFAQPFSFESLSLSLRTNLRGLRNNSIARLIR